MATTMSTGYSIPVVINTACARSNRRLITPQAGRALKILGHAIEYLTDEFTSQGLTYASRSEQLEAVQILMALNRQVYNDCPEVPSLGERCRALLHSFAA